MTGKENGVAAKKLPQFENMLNVHCIYDQLALVCAYVRDDLQFIQDFETTRTQLWAFFKSFSKWIKVYIKITMQIKEFENLSKEKENKVIKSVKRAVRTRWLSLEVAVNGVFKEYSHLVHTLRELQQDPTQEALPKAY